jgi:L-cysteine:1D-myo-inositol 2-amino-2-deoxy-alpha-D-glucopyranoside ligase
MQTLNVRPPDHYPRATDVIPEIIDTVQKLLAVNVAYESGGNVYFNVDAWPAYGQLSHIRRENMLAIANERGNRPDDPHKHQPLDFVLWQAQVPGEPAWPSPWGLGRPGWHIECSTLSTSLLGPTIDLHGGGADLVFPHHDSEIAQAECATGQHPFVRFWLHTAMVEYQGEKMSKSLGNLVMVSDLLKTWSADALRLYLARHHYRETWSYSLAELEQAETVVQQWRAAVSAVGGDGPALDVSSVQSSFTEAMDNDLDTPAALEQLDQVATKLITAAQAGQNVAAPQVMFRTLGRIFGLRLNDPDVEERVITGWNEHLKRFA